jgi:hypothetical protein
MADSLLCLEKRPLTFIPEFIQYMLHDTGFFLSFFHPGFMHIRDSESSGCGVEKDCQPSRM